MRVQLLQQKEHTEQTIKRLSRDSLFIVCVYANLRINLQNMTAHVKRPFSQGRRLARDVGGTGRGGKIFFVGPPNGEIWGTRWFLTNS